MACRPAGTVKSTGRGVVRLATRRRHPHSNAMIRSDLVYRLAALNPHLNERECRAVVDAILGRVTDALVAGDRVEIRGFGSFSGKEQPSRQGHDPRTGAQITVQAKTALAFKAGKEMRDRVNLEATVRCIEQRF